MAGLIVIGILFGIFAGTLVALVADERENLPKFIPLMFTTKRCENCGTENTIDAKYCEQCGEKFENAQE